MWKKTQNSPSRHPWIYTQAVHKDCILKKQLKKDSVSSIGFSATTTCCLCEFVRNTWQTGQTLACVSVRHSYYAGFCCQLSPMTLHFLGKLLAVPLLQNGISKSMEFQNQICNILCCCSFLHFSKLKTFFHTDFNKGSRVRLFPMLLTINKCYLLKRALIYILVDKCYLQKRALIYTVTQ